MRAMDIVFFCLAIQLSAFLLNTYNIFESPYADDENPCFNQSTYGFDNLCPEGNLTRYWFGGGDIQNESTLNASLDQSNMSALRLGAIRPGLIGILDVAKMVIDLIGIFTGVFTALYDMIVNLFGSESVPFAIAIQTFVDIVAGWGIIQFITNRGGKSIE